MKSFVYLMLALILGQLSGFAAAAPAPRSAQPALLQYLSPSDGAQLVPAGTTVALRLDRPIDPASLSASIFSAVGSLSGPHTAQARLADDGRTVVFQPASPFAPGESVQVSLSGGLATTAGSVFAGVHSQFRVSHGQVALPAGIMDDDESQASAGSLAPAAAPAGSFAGHPPGMVTFPHDFPNYTVTVPAHGTSSGLLFMAPFSIPTSDHNFRFILNDSGQPVFWQESATPTFDFKVQPDGSLTYYNGDTGKFSVLDNTYSQTRSIGAANGYATDFHDLQILPNNGHALLLIYDSEITSTLQFGGYPTATVVGLVIQELDTSGLPVFQWDSWSHIPLSDTQVSLTTPTVDYVHGNAIELDQDGNLLLSSRHLSEITKIDRNTGAIIWRWGGKANQFNALTPDPDGPFAYQHDIRRLPNGHVTIFDNHVTVAPFSRAVEYELDEVNKVYTNTWEYRNTPDIFSLATGDNQRLPDGHRLIGWGFGHPNVTEVLTDGNKAFEMTLDPAYFTYRAFRFSWSATPKWDPLLVLAGVPPALYYSWNGATDVAAYDIFGGFGQTPNILLGRQSRTGFEDHTDISRLPRAICSFRVRPVNQTGQPQRFSNIVYRRFNCDAPTFFTFSSLLFGH